MITVLLEQIIQLLKGWIDKFNDHAEAVEDSLTDLNNTASDIELNTDPIPDIRDNTGAIITPITQIKTNTDSIKTDVTQIKTDTGIIKNNANSISTSAGSAAAFAEDFKAELDTARWMCGFPEKFVVVKTGSYIVTAFGVADIMDYFKTTVSAIDGAEVVLEGDIAA